MKKKATRYSVQSYHSIDGWVTHGDFVGKSPREAQNYVKRYKRYYPETRYRIIQHVTFSQVYASPTNK